MTVRGSERGFALLVTLWLITALGILAGAAMAAARTGGMAARNRIVLRRAAWAREACLAILRADTSGASLRRGLDSVDLGNSTWCKAVVVPIGGRLNVNLATPAQLRILLPSDSLVEAVLDWRDTDDKPRTLGAERAWYASERRSGPRNGVLLAVEELALIRGFDDQLMETVRRTLTTRGDGRLSLEAAPLEVLAALPGMTAPALRAIERARASGRSPRTVAEVLAVLAPSERQTVMAFYADLTSAMVPESEYTAHIEGVVGANPLHAHAEVRLVRLPSRLAIVGRESW